MAIKLYYSNSIESLAERFSEKLDENNACFDPQTVIVPNPYLKKWLQMKIAETSGISINLDFRFLNQGLWKILTSINNEKEKPVMMEQHDLQLMLLYSIQTLKPDSEKVKPFAKYLFNGNGEKKAGFERRVWQLSARISRYFIEYEYYREEMIKSWMSGKLIFKSEMEPAEQSLYDSVFRKNGYRDRIDCNLLTLPQYWQRSDLKKKNIDSKNLFIFGKSQLSPFHIKMIYELGKILDLYIYQTNPCSEFWEDVSTPGEDRWERVRSIRVESGREGDFLEENEDENNLLKLWGKSGRETVKLFSLLEETGSKELKFISEWIYPEYRKVEDSCLHALQNQILNRSSFADKTKKLKQDKSIQIAACPDIYRETESVYNSILNNLKENSALKMTDIAVMLPDMKAYGAVIRSVFSRNPKRISYSIIDSSAASDSLFANAILSILDIASGSFTRAEIFNLLFNQCFLETLKISAEDVNRWLIWADKLNIFRSFNKDDTIDPLTNLYTWQLGLQRLRFGRIMELPEMETENPIFPNYKNLIPFSDMKSQDQHLINKLNYAIELIFSRTGKLKNTLLSGEEWIKTIESLVSDFLAIPEDRPEEIFVYKAFMEKMSKLTMLDSLSKDKKNSGLSLSAIKEFIKDNLMNIPGRHGSYLTSGVNISALVPKREIPFKIIYIMGMEGGVFPGNRDSSTLDLRNFKRKIGDISKPDANRYLFLQTLISTREKLYITYISKDPQKDEDFYPNSVIGQFITYINNHVITHDFRILEVPASGSSGRYLDMDKDTTDYSDFLIVQEEDKTKIVNYSESDRLVLLDNLAKEKSLKIEKKMSEKILKKINSAMPDFTIKEFEAPDYDNKNIEIRLRELKYFLINPVESALRRHLHISDLDVEDKTAIEDEPFFSVYPFNYIFTTDTINYYIKSEAKADINSFIEDYYIHSRLKGNTPEGAFGDIDLEEIKNLISERLTDNKNNSIAEFIEIRKNLSFYRNIIFGDASIDEKAGQRFPALEFDATKDNKNLKIELSGLLPFIWKKADESETIVLTNSSKTVINHLIYPFLFYIAARSGFDKNLKKFIGPGTFYVHVSHKKGIDSYGYCIKEDICREYLENLIINFLDEKTFDMLPVRIISEDKMLSPLDMKKNPDDTDRELYRKSLIRQINNDSEKSIPLLSPMKIMEIIDAKVPYNAYDKVRDRCGLLIKPFKEDKE